MADRCKEGGAPTDSTSCEELFHCLLALDHQHEQPWASFHALNVACYTLQHPPRPRRHIWLPSTGRSRSSATVVSLGRMPLRRARGRGTLTSHAPPEAIRSTWPARPFLLQQPRAPSRRPSTTSLSTGASPPLGTPTESRPRPQPSGRPGPTERTLNYGRRFCRGRGLATDGQGWVGLRPGAAAGLRPPPPRSTAQR